MSTLDLIRAFMRRDWRIQVSYRTAFALQAASSLLLLALFYYLGRVVDETEFGARQGLQGGYFSYVAVGLALFHIVAIGMGSFSYKLREEQITGTVEALLASPTRPSLIILGLGAYELLRSTIQALFMLLAAILLFGLSLDLDLGSLAIAALALAGWLGLFTSIGVGLAAFTVVFKQTAAVIGFLVTLLALCGGVYFPVDVLPGPIEAIGEALPSTWGLGVLRDALLGGDVDPLELAGLLASVAVLLPIGLAGFALGLRRAKQAGSLVAY